MSNKRQLARERLFADIDNAISTFAARDSSGYQADATLAARLRLIESMRSGITRHVVDTLRRNWRVTERARGARTVD